MRIKLDENLGLQGATFLEGRGHDVLTVSEQALWGAADRDLASVCARENRVLVSLDLHFANPLLFDPSVTPGIVVLRLSSRPSRPELKESLNLLAGALERRPVKGKLWIVQRGAVREYQQELPDD
jgi:predicted nuclease of predicted toxin-antitoxin system